MRCICIAAVTACTCVSSLLAQQPVPLGTVVVTAAIVRNNLEIRPVPLHELVLIPAGGTAEYIELRTGLDGKAMQQAPAGRYELLSRAPAQLDGRRYLWDVQIQIPATGVVAVELTNVNASIDSSGVQAATLTTKPDSPGRQMAPELEVYQRIRLGVVRVEAGLQSGSGFLVDGERGLLLTNAHVVDGQGSASIVLDSMSRWPVQIVARDNDADVAVLRVARQAIVGRPVLPLAERAGSAQLVEPGERIFAVGYPLHQEQTLTSGIASSIRDGAVISDVNINHGNSGGPLLNMAGNVVAINTFGDIPDAGGPGLSGSVIIVRAARALAAGRATADTLPLPPAVSLAVLPRARYSVSALRAYADTLPVKRYSRFESISAGRFELQLRSPVIAYLHRRAFEADVGKDRKKREAQGGVATPEQYSELREVRDWDQYVGDDRVAVVAIAVLPKIGETGGSLFRRLMLTGVTGKQTLRFRGDLRDARIFRNGERVTPIVGGHAPVKEYINNRWVDLKDVADLGYYVISPDVLSPGPDGTPPTIVLDLIDLKNPDAENCRALPPELVADLWNDFEPFFAEVAPGRFQRADPTKPPVPMDARSVCTPGVAPVTEKRPM